ncbi:MAG: hemerythrin domain-containing protein [Candidatus Brocadiaceae bacterium]|nr:hemerythrin domain-containing protein [Candidatus Brocadiaceae bacterium]
MSILIEELKKEHAEIVATLNEVKRLGILSKEGQDKLMSVEASLLAHLEIEDDQMYPALQKEADKNKNLKNTLDLFAMDMENVSKVVQDFFDKYSEELSGDELQKDFENLYAALNKRISNEEESLYEEYEYMKR